MATHDPYAETVALLNAFRKRCAKSKFQSYSPRLKVQAIVRWVQNWPAENGELYDTIAVFARRQAIKFDPSKSLYRPLLVTCVGLTAKEASTLARVCEQFSESDPDKIAKGIKAKGGVDKLAWRTRRRKKVANL